MSQDCLCWSDLQCQCGGKEQNWDNEAFTAMVFVPCEWGFAIVCGGMYACLEFCTQLKKAYVTEMSEISCLIE